MENRLEIIAIDHGWSNIKTVNTVFSTAVNQIANEPGIFDNILQYEGKFYSVGGKRLEVKDNKVTDESFLSSYACSYGEGVEDKRKE